MKIVEISEVSIFDVIFTPVTLDISQSQTMRIEAVCYGAQTCICVACTHMHMKAPGSRYSCSVWADSQHQKHFVHFQNRAYGQKWTKTKKIANRSGLTKEIFLTRSHNVRDARWVSACHKIL